MKYAQRYGKKGGKNRSDLLKVIHYGIIALYINELEGERRSIAMNWNVTDTEQQLRLFMSEREEKQYDEYLETKKANDE